MLANRIPPRRLPDNAKQAWSAEVEAVISSTTKQLNPSAADADDQWPVEFSNTVSGSVFLPVTEESLEDVEDTQTSSSETP